MFIFICRFIELVARRLKIKKLSRQRYSRTIQYKTRNETKLNEMR